jgi:hypothetical protein
MSIMVDWFGHRTLNQRVVGLNTGEGTVQHGTCEHDALKSTVRVAMISRIACGTHSPLTSVRCVRTLAIWLLSVLVYDCSLATPRQG